ncbi:hypothetical protein MRB53_038628 [Persea americana]|nr:hypothetical protein MRB53_038628 [Persea americana]
MNSMNFISAIGASTPARQKIRSASEGSISRGGLEFDTKDDSTGADGLEDASEKTIDDTDDHVKSEDADSDTTAMFDEKSPLLRQATAYKSEKKQSSWVMRTAGAISGTFSVVLTVLLAPGRYIVACFYDDDSGRFSIVLPLKRIGRKFSQRPDRRKSLAAFQARSEKLLKKDMDEITTQVAHDDHDDDDDDSPARHTRSKSFPMADTEDEDAAAPKRSIRIKVLNEDAVRQRRRRRPETLDLGDSREKEPPLTAETLKSPTSPTSSLRLTKYPRAPAPPRPLIPRRQPSYTSLTSPLSYGIPQKTLILDLDETLIHSMARGGKMGPGHPIEVRIQQPVGVDGVVLAPQVPILYYVYKRPHCEEFLKKVQVSKWYNLIIFTAAVQEYADPVIDWLEMERKYFSARYYRQHCTYRNGAYIKDLSQVEPDLSKVLILDNSPVCYVFHEGSSATDPHPLKTLNALMLSWMCGADMCYRQRDTDRRLDRVGPDGQSPLASHSVPGGIAVRDGCARAARVEDGRGGFCWSVARAVL